MYRGGFYMKRKKVIILLLAAMMTASMAVPASAAINGSVSEGTDIVVGAESVVKQSMEDISQEMYKLPQEGCTTMQLTRDAVIKAQQINMNTYYMDKITIDLNGHNLSIENDVNVGSGATFTITGEGNVTGLDNVKVNGGTFNDNHTEGAATPTTKPTAKPTTKPSVKPTTKPTTTPVSGDAVASIGDELYASLQDAVDASKDGRKIVLLKPVDISKTGLSIPSTKRISLDLAEVNAETDADGEKTIAILTGTGDKGITVEGALAITDSDGEESIIATKDESEGAIFTLNAGGALYVAKGSIDATGSHAVIANDHSNFKIKADDRDAAKITATGPSTIVLNDEAVMEMKSGTILNLDGVVLEDHSSKTVRFSQDCFLRSGQVGKTKGTHVISTDAGQVAIAGGIYRTDNAKSGTFDISGTGKVVLAGGYYKQDVADELLAPSYTKTTTKIVDNNATGKEVFYYAVTKSGEVSPEPTKEVTPTIPVAERFGTIYSTNLSLKGKVGLNVYLALPERILTDEDATIEITRNGKTETFKIADLESFEVKKQTLVSVTTYVTAKEMSDDIDIKVIPGTGGSLPLKDTAGNKSKNGAYTTSVAAYLKSMKGNKNVSKSLQTLYDALGTYGEYAQLYFKHNSEGVEPVDTLADVADSTFKSFQVKKSGSLSGVSYLGGNLILDSDTTLMVYFKSKNDLSGYKFTIDGKEVEAEKDGTYYILTLDGIEAKNLDKAYDFAVSNGKNTLSVKYSALTYADSTISQKNTDLINLMKAMYKYNVAADAYFK